MGSEMCIRDRLCPACNKGELHLRLGKFGSFVGCNNYPDCSYTRKFGKSAEGEVDAAAVEMIPSNVELGEHPDGTGMIYMKKGPYGFYVQLGEAKKGSKTKPKRASLDKEQDPNKITLEEAVKMLILPRTVGTDPESGEEVLANKGRFGPYVQLGKTFASLKAKDGDEIMTVTLERALKLIEDKRNAPPGRRYAKKKKG